MSKRDVSTIIGLGFALVFALHHYARAQADACANATLVGAGSYAGSTAAATGDGAASCGVSNTTPDVWYRYTAGSGGPLLIDTCGSSYDTVLSIHTGCPGSAANELACNDDACANYASVVQINAAAGQIHYIRVSGWNGHTGNYVLNVAATSPPANDSCGNATPIGDGSYSGNTTLATNDGVAACGESNTTADVWYRYTAAADGVLRVNTCGSSYDTVLSIHTGCPGSAANQLACNDDSCGTSSVVAINATAGSVYFVRVSGWRGATGAFRLSAALSTGNNGGPDVVLGELNTLAQFGRAGDIVGCGLDSPTCNGGGAPLDWYGNPDPRHPFMVGNLYRLKAGRFEQIGQSWIKHGFGAAQNDACGLGCIPHPNGTQLGVGCSDTYGAALNAQQNGLGPRYELNPFTGAYTFAGSFLDLHANDPVDGAQRRLEVHDADLDPANNAGAQYFCEMYILAHDDVDHANSIAWEPVQVAGSPGGTWNFNIAGANTHTGPALDAWPADRRTTFRPSAGGDGQCALAVRVTSNGDGTWHYEYAALNRDLARAVGRVSIPVAAGVTLTNIGFHAVESHDEPYSNAPWTPTRLGQALQWETAGCCGPSGNPLRWGTLYTFRFDASTGPHETTATLGLYQPGTPDALTGTTLGPSPASTVRGDMNCDGMLNVADVGPFVLALLDPAGYAAQNPACEILNGDMNVDGVVDGVDTAGFTSALMGP